jgi:hypothetical protein
LENLFDRAMIVTFCKPSQAKACATYRDAARDHR